MAKEWSEDQPLKKREERSGCDRGMFEKLTKKTARNRVTLL